MAKTYCVVRTCSFLKVKSVVPFANHIVEILAVGTNLKELIALADDIAMDDILRYPTEEGDELARFERGVSNGSSSGRNIDGMYDEALYTKRYWIGSKIAMHHLLSESDIECGKGIFCNTIDCAITIHELPSSTKRFTMVFNGFGIGTIGMDFNKIANKSNQKGDE